MIHAGDNIGVIFLSDDCCARRFWRCGDPRSTRVLSGPVFEGWDQRPDWRVRRLLGESVPVFDGGFERGDIRDRVQPNQPPNLPRHQPPWCNGLQPGRLGHVLGSEALRVVQASLLAHDRASVSCTGCLGDGPKLSGVQERVQGYIHEQWGVHTWRRHACHP